MPTPPEPHGLPPDAFIIATEQDLAEAVESCRRQGYEAGISQSPYSDRLVAWWRPAK